MADHRRVSRDEVVVHFQELEDPRSTINQRHPLASALVIALLAVLAGAGGPTAIARWAALKEELLVRVLDLPNGIPRKDVFRRVLMALQPAAFQACFANWLRSLRAEAVAETGVEQPVLAVDGWHEGTAFVYGRRRKVRWKEIVCVWRVSGHEVPVKAVAACVEGYKKRFTPVTSAAGLTGFQVVELFAARFRQEDGFRDLKPRLGWEECRAWTRNPIERTSQSQWVTMSLLRLAQFRLQAEAEVGWWFRPPWNRKKDRPSALDVERLLRRHRQEIQQLLSGWLGDEGQAA
jgi:hypothetical protein